MNRAPTSHRRPRTLRRVLIAAAAGVAALATALTALPAAQAGESGGESGGEEAPRYEVGGLPDALGNFFLSPGAVEGANDWECEPSAEHPEPVVLVHATGVNLGANWAQISPTLANEGHCVYGFNYGMGLLSMFGRIGGLRDVASSAGTLDAFVDRVLEATGAEQVDLVGHSQGGMMPHYYIKRLGGAPLVDDFVAMVPSNHGTTLSGLTTIGETLGLLGLVNGFFDLAGLEGLRDQEVGSEFMEALFADGDTVPGVDYTVITTRNDAVVTPYTNSLLDGPDVTNIELQEQCPDNPVGHVGVAFDGPTVQNIVNALGADDPDFQPACEDFGPSL
ncbi:alpha/beta fold hydrolase [Streptomyces sp. DSM 44917]|uniref:Alpha/beta fold hydrolase n=1 Tax=Streptomyces boetiae TaxID=3075541 RepID=A0ABU2L9S4_9ACTN|nr:alpha/beta fold hydrolase [Streptomyces sp. DSM 44917]MDT0308023.1 alpha/beta fold hydrolase [Streptomyces sp. DSM 44917]